MSVIPFGVELQCGALDITENPTQICMKVQPDCVADDRLAVPGRENQMDVNLGERL